MGSKYPLTVFFSILSTLGLFSNGCAVEADDAAGIGAEPFANDASALCRNALSPAEAATVLRLIDNICGDTWCEGDHNFAFDKLTCRAGATSSPNGGSCRLELRIFSYDDDATSYTRACTTRRFFGFESLVETSESGYQSLDWDYYLALTDCISELEAKLPG